MTNAVKSKIISFLISEKLISVNEIDVYEYGIKKLIKFFATLVVICSVVYITKQWIETAMLLVGFIPFRLFAGGYHSNTSINCNRISLVVYLTNLLIIDRLEGWITLPILVSGIILLIVSMFTLAPIDHKNKRLTLSEYKRNKKMSRRLAIGLGMGILLLAYLLGSNNIYSMSIMMGSITASISLLISHVTRKGELQ